MIFVFRCYLDSRISHDCEIPVSLMYEMIKIVVKMILGTIPHTVQKHTQFQSANSTCKRRDHCSNSRWAKGSPSFLPPPLPLLGRMGQCSLPFYSRAFTRYVFLQGLQVYGIHRSITEPLLYPCQGVSLFLLCISSMTDPDAV